MFSNDLILLMFPQVTDVPRVDVRVLPAEELQADFWDSPWLAHQLGMQSGYSKETSSQELRHLLAAC